MKKLAIMLCLSAIATGAFAQGLVKFQNSNTMLITAGGTPTDTAAQGFYYGLLVAPEGVTDLSAFTFSGTYATNTALAGRLQGGSLLGVPVAGWTPGTTKNFVVAGWSASLGHDFNAAWLTPTYSGPAGFFGLSMIGTGMAGGIDSLGGSLPALVLFGAAPSITAGFDMSVIPVPEPTSMALAGLGAAAMLIFRRRK